MDNETDLSSQQSPSAEPASKRQRTSTLTSHPSREVGLMRNLPGAKFSSFIGSASGIHFIRSVYGAIRHSHPSAGPHIETPGTDIVPGEDDYLPSDAPGSSRRLWKDHEITTQHISHIDFQDLIKWSGSYFANWHPAYPFLHAPAVLEFFDKVSQNGMPAQDTYRNFEMIVLRSIMSISLADQRQDPSSIELQFPSSLVFESYDAAIDSVQAVLSRPASIQALQAVISVQLFLVSMLRLNAASRLGGLIIRMALQLGLHRCPNRFPSFSPSERELRQRLFWSIYCIDRSICQSMGLPLSLRDDDIDVCYPSRERHQAQPSPPDPRLRLVEFLARHSEIRGQIMELRNKSIQHSQRETDQAVAITAKLAQWWNDIEEFTDSDAEVISPYHRIVLTSLHHESIISLNRPILASSTAGSAYDAALQQCLGSARSVISTLHGAISQERNGGEQRTALPLLWPSFTWAVWMSTFILFYAANSKHVSQSMVSRLAERSLTILYHVSRRGNVWPDACANAIQHLRLHLLHGPPDPNNAGSLAQNSPHSASSEIRSATLQAQSTARPTSASATLEESNTSPIQPSHHASCQRSTRQQINQTAGLVLNPFSNAGSEPTWAANTNRTSRIGNAAAVSDGTPMDSASIAADVFPSDINGGLLQWNGHMQSNDGINEILPLPTDDNADLFAAFDIPFWLGQDQYAGMVNEWS